VATYNVGYILRNAKKRAFVGVAATVFIYI
jgi:hypothetical protein